MTKLTDAQTAVLTAALDHPALRVLPLPAGLRGGAGAKVVNALMGKGLVAEVAAGPDEAVWRGEGAGAVTLVAAHAAIIALGREPHSAPERAAGGPVAQDLPVERPGRGSRL